MARTSNVFHNLVTDEDSTTELLCNLMQFAAFRRPLLTQILSEKSAAQVTFEDIDTQLDLKGSGRADIVIKNDEILALVEVKVTQFQGLTDNQPKGYFSYLLKDKTPKRWLLFLVPQAWVYLSDLEASLKSLTVSNRDGGVLSKVVFWEDVLDVIEKNDLQAMNPFLGDFYDLLVARLRPPAIVFSTREVLMLFSKEFPTALSKLDQLIVQIKDKGSAYTSSFQRSRTLCPEEYGLYFRNARDDRVLWFGAWTKFWMQEGLPLCFGVDDKWPDAVRKAFHSSYKGDTKRCEDWTLGWVTQDAWDSKNAVEQVWRQLAPVLEAVTKAVP
jgi:hypothetical protein